MEYTIRSFKGTRTEQQDRAAVIVKENGIFAVVCDGMGGCENGGTISRVAVEELCFRFEHSVCSDFIGFMSKEAADLDKKIGRIYRRRGGTTLLAAFVDNSGKLSWFSLGDSRLYLYGKDGAEQLTEDHNYFAKLNKMLAEGRITEETYRREAQRGHALTSFLGVNGLSLCCTGERQIERTDVVLLTSDGLYKAVRPESFCEIVRSGGGLESAADDMLGSVCKIKDRAIDNTTFILIGIGV